MDGAKFLNAEEREQYLKIATHTTAIFSKMKTTVINHRNEINLDDEVENIVIACKSVDCVLQHLDSLLTTNALEELILKHMRE